MRGTLYCIVVLFSHYVDCVSLALKSPYGECSIKYVLYRCIVLWLTYEFFNSDYQHNFFFIIEHKKMPSKKVTAEKCTQVAIETTNTGVQTDDLFITGADYDKLINNVTEMNLSSEQRLVNHFAEAELQGGSMNTQAPVSFGTQQIGPYFAAQMWPSISQYPGYANMNMYSPFLQEPSSSVPSSMAVSDGISSHPNIPYNHNVPDMCHTSNPMMSSSASVQKTTSYQKMTMNTTSPKDIVDEREDLAIEQSLNDFETMELKSQPSYASALHLGEYMYFLGL